MTAPPAPVARTAATAACAAPARALGAPRAARGTLPCRPALAAGDPEPTRREVPN